MSKLLLPVVVALGFLVHGCMFEPGVCTMEFRMYHVEAVDEAGDPVPDAVVSVVRKRDGHVIDPCRGEECHWGTVGRYLILSDAHHDKVSRRGDTFTVTITADGKTGTADFVFYHDGCHVNRRSGPRSITLR
jgi:hypothetical protein